MRKVTKLRKTGLRPGQLIFTGKAKDDLVEVAVTKYNETELTVEKNYQFTPPNPSFATDQVLWINVDGIHDTAIVRELGEIFSLHPLLQEDIVSINQRPKSEYYENCIFVCAQMYKLTSKTHIEEEQITIVLKGNKLLSFQEVEGDLFNEIRNNLSDNVGRLRKKGADYLMYRMLDVIVDHYFLVIDRFEDRTEHLEDQIAYNSKVHHDINIRNLKKEIIHFKRGIRPLNEALNKLIRDDLELIHPDTRTYLNDVQDHLIQVLDELDVQKEYLHSLNEQYNTNQTMKLNQIMKFLTVVSTIFIPLTFLVGVYGMNFKYMPELKWEYGYPAVWALMIVLAISMLLFFRVKKWW